MPLPLDSEYRKHVNKYKSEFLYNDAYEICTHNTQTKIFDEPLRCASADYISYFIELLYGDDVKQKLYMADGIHPERYLETTKFNASILSNREGDVFFMRLNIPYEHIKNTEVEDVARILTRDFGSPEQYDESSNINYKWITFDGFDVNLFSGRNGYSLEFVDREGYDALNGYIKAKLN